MNPIIYLGYRSLLSVRKDQSNKMYDSTQANQREEEYKNQIKTLTTRLKEV